MFTQQFKPHACEGDTITCTIDGFDVTATLYRDDTTDAPYDRDDGFWPSLDPQAAGYIGESDDINDTEDKMLARYNAAFEHAQAILDAWTDDEWFYCGIAVTVARAGVQLTGQYDNALWSVECNYPDADNSYLRDVANQLIEEATDAAREKLNELCAH